MKVTIYTTLVDLTLLLVCHIPCSNTWLHTCTCQWGFLQLQEPVAWQVLPFLQVLELLQVLVLLVGQVLQALLVGLQLVLLILLVLVLLLQQLMRVPLCLHLQEHSSKEQ